ncbi:MAG: tripartite tricarboxylate transporter substrate binding protein [Chloroflexi bacterium]|nr:tripartite tricarboxylate transporter substrate binding protein [Chloroflexota bacterium]
MFRKTSLLVLGLLIVAVMIAACASESPKPKEEPYPTKQITYMIPFDPGGQSDREARRQQPFLEKSLGQKVTIDYKVGGGGAVGWAELVRAKPDGYYVAGINLPHIILQPLQQESGYKTEQILPVAFFQRTPLGLAVLTNSPHKTLKDFLDAAKAKPGDITIGGSGTFSGHHIATLRLQKMGGVKFNYVPFTGAAPQMTGFLGGHVIAVVANSDDLVKYKDQIRVLGMMDADRFPALPDAPTFREGGVDMIEAIDRGVGVPAGTPDYIVKKLEAAYLEIAKNPDVIADMKKQGFVPLAMGAKESKEHVDKMLATYKELVKDIK